MKYQIVLGLALLLVIGVFCDDKPEESDTCTPGENYEVGCNSCRCPDSGKKSESACTLKACPDAASPSTSQTDTDSKVAETDKCTPGTTFQKDDCNTCTCPENGSKEGAPCTAIACESKQP